MTLMHNAGAGRIVHPGLRWRGSDGIIRGPRPWAHFCPDGRPQGPIGVLPWLSVMLDLAAFARLGVRKTGVLSGKRSCARVAERQTRWLQVPVSERAWGFKSPLAHANGRTPVLGPGFFCFKRIYEDFPAARSNPPGMTGGLRHGAGKSGAGPVPSWLRPAAGSPLWRHLWGPPQQEEPTSSSVP